jgi:oxygen-independent coproporphyrinogen-3 oxidase
MMPRSFKREMTLLRNAALTNVNIDLIAGLPEQTLASMDESLAWIKRLAAPHVSLYIFEIDEDSRLGNEIILGGQRYGAPRVPNDELTAQLYEKASQALRRMGYHHYEISNYAHPGFESRHNLKYWLLEPYVGFGLDAHSFDGHHRWSNADTFDRLFQRRKTAANHQRPGGRTLLCGPAFIGWNRAHAAEWRRFAEPIDEVGTRRNARTCGSAAASHTPGSVSLKRSFPRFSRGRSFSA